MIPQPHELLARFDRLVSEGKDRETAMLDVRAWLMACHEEQMIEALAQEADEFERVEESWGRVAKWLRSHLPDPE